MYEMVKYRLVPNIEHTACFQSGSQTMGSECSQCDCQETKHSCDPKEYYRHFVTMSFRAKSRNLKF